MLNVLFNGNRLRTSFDPIEINNLWKIFFRNLIHIASLFVISEKNLML